MTLIRHINLLNSSDTKIDPATSDAQASLLAAVGPYTTVLAVWKAAVDSTENGKTLETLKGSALSTGLDELRVFPELTTDDIRFVATGNASATSPKFPVNGDVFPINKTLADNLKFFCIAGGNLTIVELG